MSSTTTTLRSRLARLVLLPCALAIGALVTLPGAAGADETDEVGTLGWRGPCHVTVNQWYPGAYGGWCDGNGPESYRARGTCSQGIAAFPGVVRWHGDRRGSFAWCPQGTYLVSGWFQTDLYVP